MPDLNREALEAAARAMLPPMMEGDPDVDGHRGKQARAAITAYLDALTDQPPELEQPLREFVDWFDTRFPRTTDNPPGVTLWQIAEKAKTALSALPLHGGEREP